MSYTLIPLAAFLVALLLGGVTLVIDAGVRLIRGERR
jgi:hypothetical protein